MNKNQKRESHDKNILTSYSQKLRKEMTKEERHLWYDFLKALPVTVKRQQIIGKFIVDFYISCANLVIELDGSQHYSDEGIHNDKERDAYLSRKGIKVLRYTNLDIQQRFQDVCSDIYRNIFERMNEQTGRS